MSSPLPTLPYPEWEDSHSTLQRILQLLGKITWEGAPEGPRWWFVAERVTMQGYSSGSLNANGQSFEVGLNVHNMSMVVLTETDVTQIPVKSPVDLPSLRNALWNVLESKGLTNGALQARFREEQELDDDSASMMPLDVDKVQDHWRVMKWVDNVLREYAGGFDGIQSPVHFFWHHMDIAHSRYVLDASGNEIELTAGFWAGDADTREPMFYAYTNPNPSSIKSTTLQPISATWVDKGGFPMAYLAYHKLLEEADPRSALLSFLNSAYESGASLLD